MTKKSGPQYPPLWMFSYVDRDTGIRMFPSRSPTEARETTVNDKPKIASPIRTQVMAEIIAFYAAAEARGEDGWKAVEKAFPGIPTDVVATAWCEFEGGRAEAWWQSIERTIDGEIIRNALAKRDAIKS